MGTLKAKVVNYPGIYGLNTVEDTVNDEKGLFCTTAENMVIDGAGKMTCRQEFSNATTGSSLALRVIYTRAKADDTEDIVSAAGGLIYSGTTTLTQRWDSRTPSQIVELYAAGAYADALTLSSAVSTGLTAGEGYGMQITINGTSNAITINGSSAATFGTLVSSINEKISGASCSVSTGYFIFRGATLSSGSINVTDDAGAASNALWSSLTGGGSSAGTFAFQQIYTAQTGNTNTNWDFTVLQPTTSSARSAVLVCVQDGKNPVMLDESWNEVGYAGFLSGFQSPNVCISAFGRVFLADDRSGGNRDIIYWSDLLDPTVFAGGDAGYLELKSAWPGGQDYIVSMAATDDKLVIFGRNTIVVYQMQDVTNDPAQMTIIGTFKGIGTLSRDSVVQTEAGIFFIHDSGIHLLETFTSTTDLARLAEVSKWYNDDIRTAIDAESDPELIKGGYYPKEGYLLYTFPTSNKTYCIHLRKMAVPDPADTTTKARTTTIWTNSGDEWYAFTYDKNGALYAAASNGVHVYGGYTPNGTSNAYNLIYRTQWLSFEDATRLKHQKSATITMQASSSVSGSFSWEEDYVAGTSRSEAWTTDTTEFSETRGVGKVRVPLGGSANVFRYQFSCAISGGQVTVHEIQLYANPARIKT